MRFSQFVFPDAQTFDHALNSRRAPWLVTAFLIGVGTIYGVLVAAFQQGSGGMMANIPIEQFSPVQLFLGNIIAHSLIVLTAHIGMTFVTWLMAKAAGGPGHLTAIYRTTGYLLPLAIPALPYLARQSAEASIGERIEGLALQGFYLPLAGLGAALVLSGLYSLFRDVQDLSQLRAGLATAGFVLFVAAVLIVA